MKEYNIKNVNEDYNILYLNVRENFYLRLITAIKSLLVINM